MIKTTLLALLISMSTNLNDFQEEKKIELIPNAEGNPIIEVLPNTEESTFELLNMKK